MRTSLKTFLEGKEKELDKLTTKLFTLTALEPWSYKERELNKFLSQTAKEAYELGKKEEAKENAEVSIYNHWRLKPRQLRKERKK